MQGWNTFFDTVVLSAFEKIRKPDPDLFRKAAQNIHSDPVCCAYVGNRISKDIVGCKNAGYSLGIILETPGWRRKEDQDLSEIPDLTINLIEDLLDIFPTRK